MDKNNYLIQSSYRYHRFPTRVVTIGDLALGGDNPVRIQSMVNKPPEDVKGTVRQIIALAEAGCEMVRMAVPSVRDAERLPELTNMLRESGVRVPLVADVHFNPVIAGICARYVEKVRINPGNYHTPGNRMPLTWDKNSCNKELEETDRLLQSLITICRDHGTAIRVGSNHGSLSSRIMSQYGDTPEGMVEAALEFIRIFNRHNFHDLVVSMKSSNVRVMVMAYRLLVERMVDEGFCYPLHLGVTEAGLGDEGRIKSAAGIGLLLDEGIGDTIRVSLTEDPVAEIPVAKQLLKRYTNIQGVPESLNTPAGLPYNCFEFKRRETITVRGIGGKEPVAVVGREVLGPFAIMLPEMPDETVAGFLKGINDFIAIIPVDLFAHPGIFRMWVSLLDERGIKAPLIAQIDVGESSAEEIIINAAITASGFMTDGLADGLWIDAELYDDHVGLAYAILQATRARITSAEFISCPSCGRTRFNIQEAVCRIRERTSHLTGLKIGIMGCIVNGPGEMADADYGYVGAGNGTISLYKGREVVQRGVKEDDAIDALINLIKANGDWKEPSQQCT